MTDYKHVPVLLEEVMDVLQVNQGQCVVDATLGGGGYSRELLKRIGPTGKLLSIDLDADAVGYVRNSGLPQNWILAHGNFSHIDRILKSHDFPAPDAIVADIGFSSYELDQSGRGLSFQRQEPLDMRFDLSQPENAEFLLQTRTEKELVKIFSEYGEEKFSRQIAKKIQIRKERGQQIKNTLDLYEVIQDALPKPVKHKADDSARRIFQALRIAVNHELSNLEEFLPKAFDLLSSGGVLAVVSFHSLEDRIVKQFFVAKNKGCVCPLDFPQCICGKTPEGKILTKKHIHASELELRVNPRSKPAKLRAIMKI